MSDAIPLGHNRSWGIGAKGVQYTPQNYPEGFPRIISEGYFHAIGIPLKKGSDFSARDDKGNAKRHHFERRRAREICGRAKIRSERLSRKMWIARWLASLATSIICRWKRRSGNEFYIPLRQIRRFRIGRSRGAIVDVDVRAGSRLREALLPIEPNLPTSNLRTMQSMVDRAVSPRRFVVILLGGFAGFALVSGLAWNLRGDFVLGEPEDAGDWDSDGAGSVVGDAAEEHFDADVVAGGDRCCGRDCRFVDFGAGAERDVVWWCSPTDPVTFALHGADFDGGGVPGGIFAGAACVADRSDGGAANRLTPVGKWKSGKWKFGGEWRTAPCGLGAQRCCACTSASAVRWFRAVIQQGTDDDRGHRKIFFEE